MTTPKQEAKAKAAMDDSISYVHFPHNPVMNDTEYKKRLDLVVVAKLIACDARMPQEGIPSHQYLDGYRRGLRRAKHGDNFGTPKEHETWLSLGLRRDGRDAARAEGGRGYRDGLAGAAMTYWSAR